MSKPVKSSMIRHATGITLALLTLVGWGTAQGSTIHKWVDEDGVTHYSDEPPEQSQSPVTELPIGTGISTPRPAEGAKQDHYYSIANQWQRMQQESRQRQERELQRAEMKRQRESASSGERYEEPRVTHYVTAYPGRYHRRHKKGRYPPITPYRGHQSAPGGQVSSGFPTN